MPGRYAWRLRFFYAEETPFHQKGELAIETVHEDDHSRDMEIEVGKNRADIGKIELTNLKTGSITVIKDENALAFNQMLLVCENPSCKHFGIEKKASLPIVGSRLFLNGIVICECGNAPKLLKLGF